MRRDRAKDNAELFAVLWNDRDTAVEVIMQLFGYRNHWSVYRAAQRLGLPRRKRGSRSDYRTPAQVASTKRACLAAQQKRAHDGLTPVVRARIAVAMAAELPDIEGRTLVRCAVCQGRMELAAPHQHGAAAASGTTAQHRGKAEARIATTPRPRGHAPDPRSRMTGGSGLGAASTRRRWRTRRTASNAASAAPAG
jgi:hypothetical protein